MPNDVKQETQKSEAPESRSLMERAWAPLWTLREEIDDLFDDFYSGGFHPFRRRAAGGRGRGAGHIRFAALAPRLDVVDREDEIQVSAELPGLEEKDIDVGIDASTLTLRGEKKEEREEGEKGGDYYLSERRYGSFHRTVPIPEGIDRDKVRAEFHNGVLTVYLPKKPEARHTTRKVEVRAR